MNKKDKSEFINRNRKRYFKYGYSPMALGWGKGGRQQIRFQVLLEIGINKKSSILDLGCGFCDLYKFLNEKEWDGNYLGIDIVEDLIIEAKRQNKGINVIKLDILEDEFFEKYDFVICSGLFNAKLNYENNYQYIEDMLKKMYSISCGGIAVDFMSKYVDFQNEIAFHADPEKIFKIAKTISKRITLRHDYMPYEFAIYIYKDDYIDSNNVFSKFGQSI